MPESTVRVVRLWQQSQLRDTPWSGRLDFVPSLQAGGPKPVVLVLPGGGYTVTAPQEGLPVARWIAESSAGHGMHAAVLTYRTGHYARRFALADLKRAIRVLRANAQALDILPDAINVLGFSAGGHLAGLGAFASDIDDLPDDDLASTVSPRINRLALVYPVVSFLQNVHLETRSAFLQTEAEDAKAQRRFSLEEQAIEKEPPPTLIVNGTADAVTPIAGARALHAHLEKNGVQVELMEIYGAPHGFVLDPESKKKQMRERLMAWISEPETALA
ncbi:MAG: alpha/beta hydrolase [Paracoccaceae bacterium]|nr:alpha/beta hydrolase [Paracoccaceae bacterium]